MHIFVYFFLKQKSKRNELDCMKRKTG